jgi:thiosulfate/3-mercaptopyruvate sulfurtransferase
MEKETAGAVSAYLVEQDWLQKQIADGRPDMVIVDMRGSVVTATTEPGVQSAVYLGARDAYDKSHIPGAVYVDWTKDIADVSCSIPAQAAGPEQVSALFGGLGIGDTTLIVGYDSHPAMQFATRLWWLCRYYGNTNVRVLSGGWQQWVDGGRPVSSETPIYTPRQFTATPHSEWIADSGAVLGCIGEAGTCIIDARDEEQFTGAIRRGRRGGHIPGAVHVPREALFESPGRLRQSDELRRVLEEAGVPLGRRDSGARRYLAYCSGGVAATSVLFALSMLGCRGLTNYDGSWNEWNLNETLPVEP